MHYWDKYYSRSTKKNNLFASNFAKFLNNHYLKKKKIIFEIACGNGRDSFYFSKKHNVYAIDNSKKAIDKNNNLSKPSNLVFKYNDVNNFSYNGLPKKIDLIYSRFFLHAINKKTELKLFKILKKLSSKKTLIALEFRTIKDPLYQKGKILSKFERKTDHYRRFIDTNKFESDVKKDFNIVYKIERFNLSKTKNDNPFLCRVLLRLK